MISSLFNGKEVEFYQDIDEEIDWNDSSPLISYRSPQRHYLTANSCVHEGYSEYDWPAGWTDAFGWLTGVKGLNLCGKAGEGAEQFR